MDQADKLLNNPIRLVVVSNLHQVASADFTALIELTGATKGNLSIQLKKLQEANYIKIEKSFKDNYPNTRCSITKKGQHAFEKHVAYLKKLLQL
jgi:DNA-binding MarR family transcriptional regulator|tara:strand:- start:329 stop:610 length:282 start_codon:yes stop_codon:yes gene_type:complete